MTVTASSRTLGVAAALVLSLYPASRASVVVAGDAAVRLRASVVDAHPPMSLAFELWRWSTDAERAPLLTALSASPPPPPVGPAASAGRGGRGGARGGRGAVPAATPAERLAAAVKAAPTVGFIWGDGPTGYSIKYAWHSTPTDGHDRVVMVADRRLEARGGSWTGTSDPASVSDFTLIELRLDGQGAGDGKASSTTNVVVDPDARTLALGGDAPAPMLLKVAR
jgi:hypothetical protein